MYVASFVALVFCDLFALEFKFYICLVHGNAILFVVSHCYWLFMIFLLICFLGLPFKFLVSGIG